MQQHVLNIRVIMSETFYLTHAERSERNDKKIQYKYLYKTQSDE